jgi:hypothetical protein
MPAEAVLNQTNHIRKLGNVVYVSGARQTLEIDRGAPLLELMLRLRYTVTNGATAPVGPLYQTLARLIRRLELIVGGRDTVISISGASLAARRAYEQGIVEYGMDATVVLTGSAATTYDVVLSVPLVLPRGRRPDDTALDLRRVSSCTLAITWGPGDCTDFYTTPNSAAISGVTCAVEGRYLLGAPDSAVYLTRTLDQVNKELTGTNTNFDMVMDRGSGLAYRSFQIETLAAEIGSDGILNAMRIEAGNFTFRNTDAVQIKGQNRRDFQFAPITGLYLPELSLFGQGITWIATDKLDSDLRLVLDATKIAGTNMIYVTREGVRPLKLA